MFAHLRSVVLFSFNFCTGHIYFLISDEVEVHQNNEDEDTRLNKPSKNFNGLLL